MPIQVEISEKYIDDLVSFYQQKQRDLHQQAIDIELEISYLNKIILQLKSSSNNAFSMKREDFSFTEPYLDKWPWVRKIRFALDFEKRPLTTKEIVDVLCHYEPSFVNDRKRVVASISSTLSVKCITKAGAERGESGEFLREDGETGEYVYSVHQVDIPRAAARVMMRNKYVHDMRDINPVAGEISNTLKEVQLPF